MYLKFFYDSYVRYWDWYGFEYFMIHMLVIGIGIDGEIGLYSRKEINWIIMSLRLLIWKFKGYWEVGLIFYNDLFHGGFVH